MNDEEVVATIFLGIALLLIGTICFVMHRREENRVIIHVAGVGGSPEQEDGSP